MPSLDLSLRYSAAQADILFKSTKKRRLITKGRRMGLTRGVAQALIEWCLDGTVRQVLWGDTVAGNIDRYVERYFDTLCKSLKSHKLYRWRKTDRILEIGQGKIDFRSADNPLNWEGFGYDFVFLNEAGIILSEPYLWENAVKPMLIDNPDAIAIIGGTPKGHNYFFELFQQVRSLDYWQVFRYSTYDNPFLSRQEIKELEASYSPEIADQEIYGRFSSAAIGSYYGKIIHDLYEDGRITKIPYEPTVTVDTWWDLGMDDSTCIWFTQTVGCELHVIDFIEDSGQSLRHYAEILQDKGYIYGRHVAPHDIEVREIGTGVSRKEIAATLGIRFDVAPRLPVQDGVEAVRKILPRCWFDEERCRQGLIHLESYRKQYNEKNRVFTNKPLHNEHSHAADAFRTLATAYGGQRTFLRSNVSAIPILNPGVSDWMAM